MLNSLRLFCLLPLWQPLICSPHLWSLLLFSCFFFWAVSSPSATLWTIALQAPLSMGFPRWEYWGGGGLPFPLSRGSSWPRDQTWVFCIGRQILYHWATREAGPIWYCLAICSSLSNLSCGYGTSLYNLFCRYYLYYSVDITDAPPSSSCTPHTCSHTCSLN